MSRQRNDRSVQTESLGGRVKPLPYALRLDLSLRTGGREKTRATRITWVTPREASGWATGLEVFLFPN